MCYSTLLGISICMYTLLYDTNVCSYLPFFQIQKCGGGKNKEEKKEKKKGGTTGCLELHTRVRLNYVLSSFIADQVLQ